MLRIAKALAGLIACAIATTTALAAYPDKPIRIIVPIAAGSVTDVILRAAINEMAPRVGQQFVIENRGGASGILGAQACAGAEPDGYTICAIYHNTVSFNPLLFKSLPYDPDNDFAPITRLFFLIEGIAVSNQTKANSIVELMHLARSKSTNLNFGTLGTGSYPELFMLWLNKQWKSEIVAVPYKGGGPIAQAIAANEIQIGDMGLGNFLGLVEGKKIKLLAVSSKTSLAPGVPTFAEAGLGGYPGKAWWGLAAPKNTPREILEILNREFVKTFKDPAFVSFLEKNAVESSPNTPDEFTDFIRKDRKLAEELINLASPRKTDYQPAK